MFIQYISSFLGGEHHREANMPSKVRTHVAGYATDDTGIRFGTIARAKCMRMLHAKLGVRFCMDDINAIV